MFLQIKGGEVELDSSVGRGSDNPSAVGVVRVTGATGETWGGERANKRVVVGNSETAST